MSMMSSVHDHSTEAFIDENPIMVTVKRRSRVVVAGGGWKWQVTATLQPQRCRQVFRGNVSDQNRRTLSDGRVVNVNASLVGLRDFDIQEGDLVVLPGDEQWECARTLVRYAMTAEVFQHAGT